MNTPNTSAPCRASMQIDGCAPFTTSRLAARSRPVPDGDLLAIIERERQRIGQDLHDGICQELAALHFALESAKKLAGSRGTLCAQLEAISLGIHRAMHHTRLICRGLAPYELEDGDLAGALQELAGTTGTLHGIQCSLQTFGRPGEFDPGAAMHLFRIAQEAIQNAVRHGRATAIDIVLDSTGPEVVLTILDNGSGPPAANPAKPARGMGWKIMRHRAKCLGGSVEMQPRGNGCGASVRCAFPA